MIRTKYILLIASLFSFSFVQSQTKRQLIPSDIYKLKTVGDGQISPEGNWVAYTLTTIDSAKDKRNTDLWMISWDGKESIQLTNSPEGESSPRWSPDGKYLSFTSSRQGGSSQIYLLNRMGGEAIKLTEVKGDLEEYSWSPDSKKILMTIKDPEDTSTKKGPMIIDRYHFKQDVQGYLHDHRKTHLYLFNLNDKKIDTLTRGMFDEGGARWSPDGSQIAFVSNHTEDPDKNENSDIFVMSSTPGSEAKQLTTWKGTDNNIQWSPDGKSIAYLQSTTDGNFIMYDQPILSVISSGGGIPKLISKSLDRPVTNIRWKDNENILGLVTDDCMRKLSSFNINNNAVTNILTGEKSIQSIETNPSGKWIASITSPYAPTDIFALENNTPRKLTTINDEFISQINFASVEKVSSKSKDGAQVSSLLFSPFAKEKSKLPAVFFIHGGPVGQDEFSFDLTRQILAAQGYAVIGVNYRGSNGRGIDYCKAIYADWGNKEVLDIQGAANNLIAKGIIDSNKMGIGGWSYGGILTDATISRDQRFKAAASGAGSAMQLSLYGVDQYITQFDNEIGAPWKDNNIEKYLKISYPFLHADKIKTPTLFMVGEKDFNVPAVGSEQMYQALRSNGVPTGLIIYPGQFHGITVPSYQMDRLNRYIGWFDKYLKVKS